MQLLTEGQVLSLIVNRAYIHKAYRTVANKEAVLNGWRNTHLLAIHPGPVHRE